MAKSVAKSNNKKIKKALEYIEKCFDEEQKGLMIKKKDLTTIKEIFENRH